ncbi:hypothetical protein [Devosia chinhatensis]|uniref:Uncharacterized protein n=1 Tax=Devosia chinhatensis TaxID=429727 RepID=A0A0F5FKQ0_9HYPH|nr:hypothetical protein [Devosia chinhatensis]KKB09378.1 hypothetical protein VE26_05410 [Devosia chinhatensis]
MDKFWTQARKQINDLIDVTSTFGVEDSAIENLSNGKPAFWSFCGNSNGSAGTFFLTINSMGGIEAGKEDIRAHFARNGRDVDAEEWLHHLIPLNRAAVTDLMRAYQDCGSWRTPEELAKRAAARGWPQYRVRGALSAPVETIYPVAAE